MSPDHQLSERVYNALKGDLLNGDLHELRLPITRLEARYHASATPVREALLRLVGEGLVVLNPTGGFGMLKPRERQIRDMYELNLQIVLAAASSSPLAGSEPNSDGSTSPPLTSIDELFVTIGAATHNLAMVALIESLNDKMRRTRRAEAGVFGNIEREFLTIERQFRHGELPKLRRALIAYHRRRIRKCAVITERLLMDIEVDRIREDR